MQLDINTVAAGGGSRLFFRAGLFVVGPESAGAHPGPVCYRKGKEVFIVNLVTKDANVLLPYQSSFKIGTFIKAAVPKRNLITSYSF